MNELRLEYQKETGTQVKPKLIQTENDKELGMIVFEDGIGVVRDDSWEVFPVEYVEWLEERLLDDEALFVLMNKILHEKNKRTEPPIPGADE